MGYISSFVQSLKSYLGEEKLKVRLCAKLTNCLVTYLENAQPVILLGHLEWPSCSMFLHFQGLEQLISPMYVCLHTKELINDDQKHLVNIPKLFFCKAIIMMDSENDCWVGTS